MRTGAYFKMSGQKAEETAANGLHPGMVSGILYKVRQGRGEQNVSFDFAERKMFRSTLRSACFAFRSRFLNLLQKIEALPLLRQCLFFWAAMKGELLYE